jgi:hypothetical protein
MEGNCMRSFKDGFSYDKKEICDDKCTPPLYNIGYGGEPMLKTYNSNYTFFFRFM